MTFSLLMTALGGGGPRITLSASYTPSSTVVGSGATAQFRLTNAGDIEQTVTNNTIVDVGDWVVPKAGFSAFDCMLTVNSGTAPAGSALATWLNLASTASWTLTRATLGTLTNNCTLQIRNATTLAVLATATVAMDANFN